MLPGQFIAALRPAGGMRSSCGIHLGAEHEVISNQELDIKSILQKLREGLEHVRSLL